MIYVIGTLYFVWNKRYIISAVFGALLTIVSAFINVIIFDYLGLVIWASIGGLIVAYAVQCEICKNQIQRVKNRNRHR